MESSEQVGFDSDGSKVIVDNSSNVYNFSEENMFTKNIEPMISNGVAAIGGKHLTPKGIGTVSWSCTDDECKYTQRNRIM